MPVPLRIEIPDRAGISAATQRPIPVSARAAFVHRAASLAIDLSGPVVAGGVSVDVSNYSVRIDGTTVALPPRQVEILALFVGGPSRVWSREELEWACWGERSAGRRIDVQLSRIRSKAGRDLFRTVRSRGWALCS